MKKRNIFPCTLAVTLLAAMSATGATAANKSSLRYTLPRATVGAVGDNTSFHRFIVTYRDGSKEKTSGTAAVAGVTKALSRSGFAAGTKATKATYMRKLATGQQLVRTSRKLDRVEAAALMRQISADPNVLSVSPDRMRQIVRDIKAPASVAPQTFTPNDSLYGQYQWHLKAPDGAATFYGNANRGGANVNNGWDLADGAGVVIAVLDTGLTVHPDVDSSLIDAGYDFISDGLVSGRANDERAPGGYDTGDWTTTEPYLSECTSPTNPPSDSSWHGTHVASTAGAELTNNALGFAGVAYGAKILPVRVLGHCGGYDSDINDAIVWAAGGTIAGVPDNANPAQVINLSLGGGGACDAAGADAVAMANSLGAVVVVSAGNSNADAANFSPASCPGVITVASTGITSKRAFYSNYGASVEIAAPGGGVYPNDGSSGAPTNDGFVWQALNDGLTTPTTGVYGGYAGTSQAAPHVSGVVALMQGARADADLAPLTPAEVLAMLQSSAHAPTVAPPANFPIGAGIVDAFAAVTAAITPPCTENCAPVATPLTNKVTVNGLAGAAGSEVLYSFEATAGSVLSFLTYGGSGDVSMYVKFGAEPSATSFDAKSTRAGNSETVRFTAARAGTYYIKLVGTRAYSNVTLVARQ